MHTYKNFQTHWETLEFWLLHKQTGRHHETIKILNIHLFLLSVGHVINRTDLYAIYFQLDSEEKVVFTSAYKNKVEIDYTLYLCQLQCNGIMGVWCDAADIFIHMGCLQQRTVFIWITDTLKHCVYVCFTFSVC